MTFIIASFLFFVVFFLLVFGSFNLFLFFFNFIYLNKIRLNLNAKEKNLIEIAITFNGIT